MSWAVAVCVRAIVIGVPVLLGVVAVAGAATGSGIWTRNPASSATPLPPSTTAITRMTLTQTEQVNGTLGYGATYTVSPSATGTITWLPAVRAVIGRGQALYRIDNKPVPLLFGGLPFYRQLSDGSAGPDVRELEQNLAALGYTGFTVDDSYTAATASAVSAWQADPGVAETGVFDPASVVLALGKVQIASLAAQLGDTMTGNRVSVGDNPGRTRVLPGQSEELDRWLRRVRQ